MLAQRQKDTELHADEISIQEMDDFLNTNQKSSDVKVTDHRAGSKMEHAKQVSAKTVQELRTVVQGITNELNSIGVLVQDAQQYQGSEKFLNVLGHVGVKWARDRADIHRHDRIQRLDVAAATKIVEDHVASVIHELGITEQMNVSTAARIKEKIDGVLKKQEYAQPIYDKLVPQRKALQAEVESLDDELKAGTIEESQRPAKEKELEAKQRQLDELLLKEKDVADILKQTQSDLPTLRASKTAADQSIQGIHVMRRDILEKFDNCRVVLETATTAMKAKASVEMYDTIDKAFNKTLEIITENNVATAGAIIETMENRIKHGSLDPEVSNRLLSELLGHINDSLRALTEQEDAL